VFGSRLEVSPRGPPATEADRTRERLRRSLGSARSRRSASLDPARPRQIRESSVSSSVSSSIDGAPSPGVPSSQSPRSPRSLSALTRRSARPKAGSDARRSAEPRTRLPERERSDRRSQRFPPRYPRSVPPGRRLRWRRSEPYLPRSHPFRCFRRRSRFPPSDGTSGSDPFAVTARQTASVGVGERHCRGHAMTIIRGSDAASRRRSSMTRNSAMNSSPGSDSLLVGSARRCRRRSRRVQSRRRGRSSCAVSHRACRSWSVRRRLLPIERRTRTRRAGRDRYPFRPWRSAPRAAQRARVHRVDHGVVRSDPFRLRERVALDGVSHRRCAPGSDRVTPVPA